MKEFDILAQYMPNFLFILLRASIFVSLLPVIGSKNLPPQFRIGFAVFIAFVLTPVVNFEIRENNIPLLILKETLLAIALGLALRFLFLAVNMAGQFISHVMGMSVAKIFNPEIGQTTAIAEAYGVMAMLIFLAMDAHHDLIYIFVKSYEVLPAGQLNIRPLVSEMLSLGSKFFVLAAKISAPVVVGLLISYLLTGFLYKAAPQMNIFFITWPLNIFLGFLLILLGIPVLAYTLDINFTEVKNEMVRIIAIAKG